MSDEQALRRFTREGLVGEFHKKQLKKRGWIEYTHGFWHLSPAGKDEATRLGFLEG